MSFKCCKFDKYWVSINKVKEDLIYVVPKLEKKIKAIFRLRGKLYVLKFSQFIN